MKRTNIVDQTYLDQFDSPLELQAWESMEFFHFDRFFLQPNGKMAHGYKFHDTKGWRIDFVHHRIQPETDDDQQKKNWWKGVAVEIEGWGHKTSKKYDLDIRKYNAINAAGYLLVRATPDNIATEEFLEDLENALISIMTPNEQALWLGTQKNLTRSFLCQLPSLPKKRIVTPKSNALKPPGKLKSWQR